ncbi:MAG: hypothetical protein QM766_17560 [Burkholderiaceae bacterium]
MNEVIHDIDADLDEALAEQMSLDEANAMLPDTSHIFSLTALIDSQAALAAAERLYASNQNGIRFFSELNRALPRSQADKMPRETEILEDTSDSTY